MYYYLLIILVPANKIEKIKYFPTILGLIFIAIIRGPLNFRIWKYKNKWYVFLPWMSSAHNNNNNNNNNKPLPSCSFIVSWNIWHYKDMCIDSSSCIKIKRITMVRLYLKKNDNNYNLNNKVVVTLNISIKCSDSWP